MLKKHYYCTICDKPQIIAGLFFLTLLDMNTEKDIITNILQIRTKKRLTQKDLSIALGISEATYNRIESGKITLSYSHVAKRQSCKSPYEVDCREIIIKKALLSRKNALRQKPQGIFYYISWQLLTPQTQYLCLPQSGMANRS